MDQVFVKAFSRRRLAESENQTERHASQDDAAATKASESEQVLTPIGDLGSLQVDLSVAETAEVWVDAVENQIARADQPRLDIPRPHVELPSPNVANSGVANSGVAGAGQHVHTAYAGAFADPSLIAASMSQDESLDQFDNQIGNWCEVESVLLSGRSQSVAEPATPPASHPATRSADDEPIVEMRIDRAVAASPRQSKSIAEKPELAVPAPVEAPPSKTEAAEAEAVDTNAVHPKETQLDSTLPESSGTDDAAVTYVPFQAVWEVDVFDVPNPVADLFFEGALFQQIAERMSDAVSSGLRSVLVTSTKPGEGRSSVAIGMAMAAAASGIRVALVDADSESPSLADELRLELQYGWVDVIRRGLPIKEIAVQAVEDGVTLIPLMPPGVRPAATGFEMVQLIDLLTSNFELIILDGPTSLSPGLHQCAAKVDSAVIVRDVTRTDELAICELSNRLQKSGVRGVGLVDNFV
jgi:Mrp family chromosome partitioning ATPase